DIVFDELPNNAVRTVLLDHRQRRHRLAFSRQRPQKIEPPSLQLVTPRLPCCERRDWLFPLIYQERAQFGRIGRQLRRWLLYLQQPGHFSGFQLRQRQTASHGRPSCESQSFERRPPRELVHKTPLEKKCTRSKPEPLQKRVGRSTERQ